MSTWSLTALPAGETPRGRADAWPLRSSLEFGAVPAAVPCARLHARHLVREWGLAGLAATTELLVSELVTNAVKTMADHDSQAPVRLRLSGDDARILIEVWDADPRSPAPEDPGADGLPDLEAEGGRGLFLVAALSARWNWRLTRQPAGKVVWCELQDDQPETTAGNGSAVHLLLPRRVPGAARIRPAAARLDPDVLRRIRDGLLDLRAH
jgi:anti-sigma regulatory factor (Ser/Thr protein kinase)